MKNADLHTHSHYSSDGTVSPTNLIKEAKKIGLKYIALTDHDSVNGVPEAIRAGKKYGVKVIPGAEIHSKFGEVLAYFIDHKDERIIGLCERNKKAVHKRALKTIKKLAKDGYILNPNKILKKHKREILERPLIAMELVDRGYAEDFRDAFNRFLGANKKYHIKTNLLSTEKVVKIIASVGGVAVLAHPYYEDYKSEFKNIRKLIKAGLVGIECPDIAKKMNKNEFRNPKEYDHIIKVAKKIHQVAEKNNLIITSGSDYHGADSPHNMFGLVNCDESIIEALKIKAENNR